MKLEGSLTALVTPFSDGEVDYPTMAERIEFQIANGTQGLVPCGTTGESPTLSHQEHDRIIEFTIEKAAGRVPVFPGTGSNSTSEALRLTRHAKDAGADGCLIVMPYYNRPTQEGLFEHVRRLADVGLPIVLYNIPSRCGIELTVETIVRMYEEIEQVVAVKEATGKVDVASGIASQCDITILSGDDSLTLPICAVGGSGVISVLSNILPGEVRQLCDAALGGDLAAAQAQHHRLFGLFKGVFVETNPIPIKAAMAMAGMITEELRLPLMPLKPQYRPALAELLRSFKLDIKT